jgi:hypothetical protein
MHLSTDPWTWVGVVLTLCIFSFLYRDNPAYRFGEHLFVGLVNGYTASFMWHHVLVPNLVRPVGQSFTIAFRGGMSWDLLDPTQDANFVVLIAGVIGALYLTRFIPKVSWLVRFPIGIFMGYYVGLFIPSYFQGTVLRQTKGTLLTPERFTDWGEGLIAVLVFIGVLCTLTYFFFSKEHKGVLKGAATIGIVFIMVGFGASFGYTVMARVSLAIGRLTFLLRDWLGLVQ